MVWRPYEFWEDGKTSHCGVDVFDFVKIDGRWRVSNSTWTVKPEACASCDRSTRPNFAPQIDRKRSGRFWRCARARTAHYLPSGPYASAVRQISGDRYAYMYAATNAGTIGTVSASV